MADNRKSGSRELGQPAESAPEFVGPDHKRFICVKCRNHLREPQQMPCGHRICRICLKDLVFEGGGSSGVVVCPGSEDESCEEEMNVKEVYPDNSGLREMKKLLVFCSYKTYGCSETMAWVKLQDHLSVCSYRLKTCPHCKLQIPVEEYEHHIDEDCGSVLIACPYRCNHNEIPRSRMNDHLRTCQALPKQCIYHHMGCDFKGSENELIEHANNYQHHLIVVLKYNERLAKEKNALEEKIERLNAEIRGLRNQLSSGEDEKNKLEINMERFKSEQSDYLDIHKQELAQVIQRLRLLEQRVADSSGDVTLEKLNGDVSMIQMRQKQQITIINDLQALIQQLSVRTDATAGILETYDSMLQQQKIKVQNLELRLTCVEATSHDGTLTWKITSFAERRRDAKEGRHISVYSEPFYSRRYGYKMCCRLYPNGDGIGAGTHLSLFFVVMKGEYDDILEWPFKHKVRLMLLNQFNSRKNREDGFKPDLSSTSYQKPVEFMNKASGCPKFISLADLEDSSNGFLVENSIYLRIIVEPPL